MDALNESHPKLLEELVPKLLTLGEVGRVLEQLLRERVSIRDLGAILEALLETAPVNKSWSRWSRPRARRWAEG
jgi:flagellar biosynthesis protein FlhA